MRVLVTGAAGQLGREAAAVCRRAGDDVLAVARGDLDVTDRDAVMGLVTSWRPEAVLHCAAHTGVDACESEIDKAYSVNALAVRWVTEACDAVDAHLVAVSTDYVFDGTKIEPYNEWDEPRPRSVYGASKLAGEREALAGLATVVRTSWVCGAGGSNMVTTVLRLLSGDGPLRFVDDQRGQPSFTSDLAPVLRRLALERRRGVHHVTNTGPVSWFEFVQCIVDAAGGDVGRVEPIRTSDLQPPRPAPRPANGVLDNTVLRGAGWPAMRDFREPLGELVRSLV